MSRRSPDELFSSFVAEGNKVIGPKPKNFVGNFDMSWKGEGSVLEFGENVTLSAARLAFGKGGGSIRLGENVTVKGRLEVNGGGAICIGAGTFLNRACDLRGAEGATVSIGKECLFSNVKVQTSDMHSILDAKTGERTNPAAGIAIEDSVWLSEDVKVAKGVRIGTGAVVAAGSLVTRSIAPFCLAAGRPARVIRAGIKWTRKLKVASPLPAPEFAPSDIPMDKEVLRYLASKGQYRLVEGIISAADQDSLPSFARWYLVMARERLGQPHPQAKSILESVLRDIPGHRAAREMLERQS